nr:ROK family transcriptional regulator [Streptomyces cavernae]
MDALRSHNTALVLDLLRAAGAEGLSRTELAERTGLTPQAVSKITARLRTEGFVAEAGRRASTGGKPRTVLRLEPGAAYAVGVHLDRDELHVVLADLTGAVVAERRAPLGLGAGAGVVLDRVVGEVDALLAGAEGANGSAGPVAGAAGPAGFVGPTGSGAAGTGAAGTGALAVGGAIGTPEAAEPAGTGARFASGSGARPPVLGVGVALPGPLDHLRGVLHRVTGFPDWDGFPLRDALARRLEMEVVVDKDTNAAALGIAVGGGLGGAYGSFAYLHLGTGLGAGLVLDGTVYRGERTGAGEFGHQVIQLDGPPCECGNRGCIEALCLAAVARGAVDEAARVLGTGAANLVGLLDIDLVLLGGRAIAVDPERFERGVGAVLLARARRTGSTSPVPVRIASGGVAEGAAQLLLAPVFGREPG